MKTLLTILLLLPSVGYCQWRVVKISSTTDTRSIEENFRRASIYSNRKLDKFGPDTMHGKLTLKDDLVLEDGGVLTSTAPFAQLAATQTFTGENTFSANTTLSGGIVADTTFETTTATTTFSGWIDIGWERNMTDCGVVASCTSTCSTGKKVVGGGVNSTQRTNLGGSYPSADNQFTCYSDTNNIQLYCYTICARIK